SKEIIDNAKEKAKKSVYTPLKKSKQKKGRFSDTPLSVGNIIRDHQGKPLNINKEQLNQQVDKIIEEFAENKGE
ncbi:MAG: hypothetical protein IKV58_01625, partial [Oscillospiraceae bacterium]|nr:hypothetical protein [Oscillospiraceae bacterium]